MNFLDRTNLVEINNQHEFALILYVEGNDPEFSAELGKKLAGEKDIQKIATKIIKERYPGVKVPCVRVLVGGNLVLSSPVTVPAQTGAKTKEPVQNTQTNAPNQTTANTLDYISHTVQSGDTIWGLSIKFGLPQSELLQVNNLTTTSSLKLGQKLTIPVHTIAVKPVVSERYGELLDWFSEAQYVFTIGKTAKVTDFITGQSFFIKRTIGANHADSETVTINDSNIARTIWGGFSWTPRAALIEVDGRKLAASMSFMPHEQDFIANNGITGHFDVYFSNSIRHIDGLPDPSHQLQVERAAGMQ